MVLAHGNLQWFHIRCGFQGPRRFLYNVAFAHSRCIRVKAHHDTSAHAGVNE
jgi:hypothetical protein